MEIMHFYQVHIYTLTPFIFVSSYRVGIYTYNTSSYLNNKTIRFIILYVYIDINIKK